jgi:hypothetical protein
MKIPKKVTERKKAANKRNAQESTGPKTSRGKHLSSRNAISHGIFAPGMLLPGENKEEFDQVLTETINDLCPIGSSEFARAKDLVWIKWRKMRLYLAETGAIAKLQADHETMAEMVASTHGPQYNRAVTDLSRLQGVEERLNSTGRVSMEDRDWLRKLSHCEEVTTFLDMLSLFQKEGTQDGVCPNSKKTTAAGSQQPASGKDAATSEADRDHLRDLLLQVLQALKRAIQREQLYHSQHMMRRAEGQRNSLLVPQEADLNRFMRYENHLSSLQERHELALERRQRMRRGEKVPPPTARIG